MYIFMVLEGNVEGAGDTGIVWMDMTKICSRHDKILKE